MDKPQAIHFIRTVFTQPFDKERFRRFVHELLNRYDSSKSQPMQVPDAFIQHIKSCQRLGTYQSPSEELLDILIVHVAEDYKIERTRTALRDFVAHKLKRTESYKEAALVAFVPPSLQNWRFSYVRMEYETIRDPKTGKIKPEERLTPARRYSYLVGVDEKSHTAQKQLVSLLADDKKDPELSAIEQAFSVEKVTKEFFSEYSRLFDITDKALTDLVKKDKVLQADFEAKHVDTAAFSKKLLGQIVFLYFIQKKGWLGVPKNANWGDGSRDFLRQLANQAIEKKQSLFNDILEPLFYDTLATDRGHEAWCKTFQCRIPFLNGGLFEPLAGYDWKNTEIHFPNSLFTNQERSAQGDVGTGILDVFDRYNFTVNEAEPLEKEVAIDPEMLGKVFENLIEDNRRKGLGAFYTPREIVHYMCQESLINYLDTGLSRTKTNIIPASSVIPAKAGIQKSDFEISRKDLEEWIHQSDQYAHYASAIEAGMLKGDHYPKPPESIRQYAREIDALLRDILVCDPAIGSGAFPVGMMMEIVRARIALTPYFNDVAERTPYHFKRHAIQNSLYGVDIDVGAVEIAKLRLWLSLVVDEEDVQQIKPLPNLDYKIMQGNSLISEFVGIDFDTDANNERKKDSSLFDEEKVKSLKEKQDKLQRELIKLHNSEGLTKEMEQILKEHLKKTAKELEAIKKENQPKKETASENFEISNLIKELDRKKICFQNESNKDKKALLRSEIENVMVKLFKAQLRERYSELKAIDEKGKSFPNLKMKEKYLAIEREKFSKKYGFDLEKIEEELREFAGEKKIRTFFPWKLYFAEVFHAKSGFDVVIGNPPYVRIQELKKANAKIVDLLKKNYVSARKGNYDLYIVFVEKGLQLLNGGGYFAFILPHKFFNAQYGEPLRELISSGKHLHHVVHFGDQQIFAGATNYVCLLFLAKAGAEQCRWMRADNLPVWLQTFRAPETELPSVRVTASEWNFMVGKGRDLFDKLQRIPVKLEQVATRIFQGLKTSADKIYIVEELERQKKFVRIFSRERKKEYLLEPDLLHPLIKGGDSRRYRLTLSNRRILFPYVIHKDGNSALVTEITLKRDYPLTWKYLNDNKSTLQAREDGELNVPAWYAYGRSQALDVMRLPKLFTADISPQAAFSFDPSGEVFFTGGVAGGYGILVSPPFRQEFILGLLNSRLLDFFHHRIATQMRGGWFSYEARFIRQLPIPTASSEKQKSVEDLVVRVLAAKSRDAEDAEADTSLLEKEIDQLVYGLYGLTKEEIEIVERAGEK